MFKVTLNKTYTQTHTQEKCMIQFMPPEKVNY